MQTLTYQSSRGLEKNISASEAIIQGIARDKGLYIPSYFPKLKKKMIEYTSYSYQDLAKEILGQYLSDFTETEIEECVEKAYGKQFDTPEITPIVKKGGLYFLELFHGPTLAFKDMALQILPLLMQTAAKKLSIEKEILILTATSGDTGKAAMDGFADVKGTKIMVFYPKDGVSFIQERQMLSQQGNNVSVVGIKGNFDDAQTGVKLLFNDSEFINQLSEKGYLASSANSINIGRLVPQIVYYIYAYATLLKRGEIKEGEKIDVVVPSGNFGNILAAYYAKQMGTPLEVLLAASNENKVIADFLTTGCYDKNREMYLTKSPSMDILVSSNLERLLYNISNPEDVKKYMTELQEKGKYQILGSQKEKLKDLFGEFANQQECNQIIKEMFEVNNYLMDTHTAVATAVAKKSKKLKNKTLVVSTANPYKFSEAVLSALGEDNLVDGFELTEKLYQKTEVKPPKAIVDLKNQMDRFKVVIEKEEMKNIVFDFLAE